MRLRRVRPSPFGLGRYKYLGRVGHKISQGPEYTPSLQPQPETPKPTARVPGTEGSRNQTVGGYTTPPTPTQPKPAPQPQPQPREQRRPEPLNPETTGKIEQSVHRERAKQDFSTRAAQWMNDAAKHEDLPSMHDYSSPSAYYDAVVDKIIKRAEQDGLIKNRDQIDQMKTAIGYWISTQWEQEVTNPYVESAGEWAEGVNPGETPEGWDITDAGEWHQPTGETYEEPREPWEEDLDDAWRRAEEEMEKYGEEAPDVGQSVADLGQRLYDLFRDYGHGNRGEYAQALRRLLGGVDPETLKGYWLTHVGGPDDTEAPEDMNKVIGDIVAEEVGGTQEEENIPTDTPEGAEAAGAEWYEFRNGEWQWFDYKGNPVDVAWVPDEPPPGKDAIYDMNSGEWVWRWEISGEGEYGSQPGEEGPSGEEE